MEDQITGLLTPFEAEHLIKNLKAFPLSEVGSPEWMKQHDTYERLNLQAHATALSRHDEFITDLLLEHKVVPLILRELLTIETWRDGILPHMLPHLAPEASLKVYLCSFHEVTICSFLEVLLYHKSIALVLDDGIVELADYCHRKLILLSTNAFASLKTDEDDPLNDSSNKNKSSSKKVTEEKEQLSPQSLFQQKQQDSVKRQMLQVQFSAATCCLSILRFITENLNTLPLSLTTRLMNTHDILLLLPFLIDNSPFTRTVTKRKRQADGTYKTQKVLEKYADQQWREVSREDSQSLSKLEAQIWLTIYNLCFDQNVRSNYAFTARRKESLMLLQPHCTPTLLDIIPPLSALSRFLGELAIIDVPATSNSNMAIIEPFAEINDAICNGVDFKATAQKQLKTYFGNDETQRRKDLAQFSETYTSISPFLNITEDSPCPPCAECSKPATKRCSQCKQFWYCSRECQVKAWKSHKADCEAIRKKDSSNNIANSSGNPTTKESKAQPVVRAPPSACKIEVIE